MFKGIIILYNLFSVRISESRIGFMTRGLLSVEIQWDTEGPSSLAGIKLLELNGQWSNLIFG